MRSDEERRNGEAVTGKASAEIVPQTILQLKRLTRDLHQRTAEFASLMHVALQQATPEERAACHRLLADVDHMRQQISLSGEIAQASMAAIARQNPDELVALRDELLSYMALFDVPTDMPAQEYGMPPGNAADNGDKDAS